MKNCKEQIIPKSVLKLQIYLGVLEAIWCSSFKKVAERLIDHIESNTPLFFRIKKSSQYYKVSKINKFNQK